jgi:hypothetical protein
MPSTVMASGSVAGMATIASATGAAARIGVPSQRVHPEHERNNKNSLHLTSPNGLRRHDGCMFLKTISNARLYHLGKSHVGEILAC